MVTFDSVEVEDIKEFEDILSNGKVTLSQAKREQIVLDDLEKIENENGVEIERDKALLREVIAITENQRHFWEDLIESF